MKASCSVIVGLGQAAAGDDGVGLVVAQTLAARGLPARESADASLVLALLASGRRVVLIDAVIAEPPGAVLRLDPGALAGGPAPLSSHGLGVAEALELARALYGTDLAADVAIVGIAIAPPDCHRLGLSPAVAAAVEPAADLAAAIAAHGITATR